MRHLCIVLCAMRGHMPVQLEHMKCLQLVLELYSEYPKSEQLEQQTALLLMQVCAAAVVLPPLSGDI